MTKSDTIFSRELVLIVDAEKDHVSKLSECFAEFDLDTVTARTGALGRKYGIELKPNIIISEIDLPDISGFDLCRQLQANNKTSDIPFIFTTWREQEIDRVVGFELGATDYVIKPIVPKEVALRTVGILRRELHDLGEGLTGQFILAPGLVGYAKVPPAVHSFRIDLDGLLEG